MSIKGAISEDLLLDYLYDELDAEARARVEHALKASPELQARLQTLQQTRALFSQAKAAEATLGAPALYTRALGVLAQEKEAKLPWWKSIWTWGGAAWGGALAAAIALVVWQPWDRFNEQTLYADEGRLQANSTASFELPPAPIKRELELAPTPQVAMALEDSQPASLAMAYDQEAEAEIAAVANDAKVLPRADEAEIVALGEARKPVPSRERSRPASSSGSVSSSSSSSVSRFGGSFKGQGYAESSTSNEDTSLGYRPTAEAAAPPRASRVAGISNAFLSEDSPSQETKLAKERTAKSEESSSLDAYEKRIREAVARGNFEDAERLLEQAFKLGLSAQKHRDLGVLIDRESTKDRSQPSVPAEAP